MLRATALAVFTISIVFELGLVKPRIATVAFGATPRTANSRPPQVLSIRHLNSAKALLQRHAIDQKAYGATVVL
jgi:hypothetical protein